MISAITLWWILMSILWFIPLAMLHKLDKRFFWMAIALVVGMFMAAMIK